MKKSLIFASSVSIVLSFSLTTALADPLDFTYQLHVVDQRDIPIPLQVSDMSKDLVTHFASQPPTTLLGWIFTGHDGKFTQADGYYTAGIVNSPDLSFTIGQFGSATTCQVALSASKDPLSMTMKNSSCQCSINNFTIAFSSESVNLQAKTITTQLNIEPCATSQAKY